MALFTKHKDIDFGVGDRIRVIQTVKDGDKSRQQSFEGMVIGIKGRDVGRTFTVRRIGEQQIGIERIFSLGAPNIEKIVVLKKGTEGVRHAKLFYTRDVSQREVDVIFSRVHKKGKVQVAKPKKKTKAKKTANARSKK